MRTHQYHVYTITNNETNHNGINPPTLTYKSKIKHQSRNSEIPVTQEASSSTTASSTTGDEGSRSESSKFDAITSIIEEIELDIDEIKKKLSEIERNCKLGKKKMREIEDEDKRIGWEDLNVGKKRMREIEDEEMRIGDDRAVKI